MAERRQKHGTEPPSVVTDGHPSLMEQDGNASARIAQLEQQLAIAEHEVSELHLRLADRVASSENAHAQDAQRIAEVLRHNGELVEEKRLLETKLRETIADYEGTVAVLTAKMSTTPQLPMPATMCPHRWTVRQAADDRGLETLLNLLSESHWHIDQIFEPRGGAYRVIAWKSQGKEEDA